MKYEEFIEALDTMSKYKDEHLNQLVADTVIADLLLPDGSRLGDHPEAKAAGLPEGKCLGDYVWVDLEAWNKTMDAVRESITVRLETAIALQQVLRVAPISDN